MFCTNCGKEVQEGIAFCPECGKAQQSTVPYVMGSNTYWPTKNQPVVQKTSYNSMCIVGLVISCISLLLNFWGLVGIAGTIVSLVGLLSYKQNCEKGKIPAIIGIVIGVYSIFYGVFVILSLM